MFTAGISESDVSLKNWSFTMLSLFVDFISANAAVKASSPHQYATWG